MAASADFQIGDALNDLTLLVHLLAICAMAIATAFCAAAWAAAHSRICCLRMVRPLRSEILDFVIGASP